VKGDKRRLGEAFDFSTADAGFGYWREYDILVDTGQLRTLLEGEFGGQGFRQRLDFFLMGNGPIENENADHADRVTVVFGDANSPEFPEVLPIRYARWIISTLPDPDTNLVLASALRRHGATCPIAVTVHTDDAETIYTAALADGTVSAVLHPFRDAADDTIESLKNLERP
jgi:hypothetical protein